MTLGQLRNTVQLSSHSFIDLTSDQEAPPEITKSATLWIASPLEIYTGLFVQTCMHQAGTYKWYLEDGAYQYEGKIFANQIHGYGQMTYPDDSNYQGLFMYNKRFGPGVFTSADGTTQDVGIWQGPHLVRLNQILISVEKIPNIARTIQGKTHILAYKNLVPVREKYKDVAKDMLKKLGGSEDVITSSDQLYSTIVRNRNSTFFNEKLFFESNFNKDIDMYVKILDYNENNEPVYKQVVVEKLLAWNNDKLAIEVMKHAFLHRNYEKLLTFKASDVLTNRRHLFLPPGDHEKDCLKFFKYCQENAEKLSYLLATKDVYVNLTDSEGNNGVAHAVIKNQSESIKVLADFGANLDNFNDECITPLMIGILKCITKKFDISSESWEACFLFDSEEKQHDELEVVGKWPEHSCASDITREGRVARKSRIQDKKYFFDLSFASNDAYPVVIKSNLDDSLEDGNKIEEITETLLCLLRSGANPNIGEVPFPPLITAVFSKSQYLVQFLLYYGANICVKTLEEFGSLSPLHVLATIPCTMESRDIAAVLLTYGAKPNELCSNTHWLPQKQELLAGTTMEKDSGKTPLHLLCMRNNFTENNSNAMCELASQLLAGKANPNLQYLGHTPLSLAIIRGNVSLVNALLATGKVNPHIGLGNNMGIALSVLTLVRYRNVISLAKSQEIFDTLERYYANPFIDIPGSEENVVEFVFNENTTPIAGENNEKAKGKAKKQKKKKLALSPIIKQFKSMAEHVLLAHVHRKICQIIYHYKFFYGIEDDIFDIIAKFIPTMKIVMHMLQLLIDNRMIMLTTDKCIKFLEYMGTFCKQEKPKKGKKKAAPFRSRDLIELIDFSATDDRYERFFFENTIPAIDPDNVKYQVCFECLKKKNKHLIICPVCNLIFFCSENCNRLNNERKVKTHPCRILFYDKELKKIEESLKEEKIRLKSIRYSEEKHKPKVDFFQNLFVQFIPNVKPLSISKPHSLRTEDSRILLRHSVSKYLKSDKYNKNLATFNSELLTRLSTVKEKKHKSKVVDNVSDGERNGEIEGMMKGKRKGRKKNQGVHYISEEDEEQDKKGKPKKGKKDEFDSDKDNELNKEAKSSKKSKKETANDDDYVEDEKRIKEYKSAKKSKKRRNGDYDSDEDNDPKRDKRKESKRFKKGKKGQDKDEAGSNKRGKKGTLDDDDGAVHGKKGKKEKQQNLIDFSDEKIVTKGDISKSKKRHKKNISGDTDDETDEKKKSKSRSRQKNLIDNDDDYRRGRSKSRRKQGEDRIKESRDKRKDARKDSKKRKESRRSFVSSTYGGDSSLKTRRKQKYSHGSSRDQLKERSHGEIKKVSRRTNQREIYNLSATESRSRSRLSSQGRKSRSVSLKPSTAQIKTMQMKLKEAIGFQRTGSKSTERMASKEHLDAERLDRKTINKEFKDSLSDICEEFDHKFWQKFMPYCIFLDGQLYYKFNNDFYQKLTYSSI